MNEDRTSSEAPAAAISPFPTHRDLYVLIAGIILGVLLSPAVLGRIAPSTHDALFVGSGQEQRQLLDLQERKRERIAALEDSGVSPVAVSEEVAAIEREQLALLQQIAVNRLDAAQDHAARMVAIVLAVIALMILEPLVAPQPGRDGKAVVRPAFARLITARYALIALWIAMVIAQPAALREVPMLFALLLVTVALIAAFVPLGPGKAAAEPR